RKVPPTHAVVLLLVKRAKQSRTHSRTEVVVETFVQGVKFERQSEWQGNFHCRTNRVSLRSGRVVDLPSNASNETGVKSSSLECLRQRDTCHQSDRDSLGYTSAW